MQQHRFPVSDRFTAIIYPGEKTCGVARVKAIMKAIAATKMADKVKQTVFNTVLSVLIDLIYILQIIVIRPSEEPVTWSDAVKEVPVQVIVSPGRNATTASSRLLRHEDVSIRTEGVFTISSADCGVGAPPLTSEEVESST